MTIKLDNNQSIDLAVKGTCEINGKIFKKKSHKKSFAEAYAGSTDQDLIAENMSGFFVLTPKEVLVNSN